jgi:hypothetical protein
MPVGPLKNQPLGAFFSPLSRMSKASPSAATLGTTINLLGRIGRDDLVDNVAG